MAKKLQRKRASLFPHTIQECLSIQEAKQRAGWSITAFDLPDAWKVSQGEGVVIAVLDTGCDLSHQDLKDNLLPGKNFINPGLPPTDVACHGSHVTGIICAANNDIGMVGIAPKAKVRPVKVLDDKGNGGIGPIIQGIKWATDQRVDFISMSLGTPMPIPSVRAAIQDAAKRGVVTFVAAGNAGNTKEVFYPAAYPETIAVGAIDEKMCRGGFSNTGPNLDFMAPGVNIFSTVPENWYATMNGSSMAQPFACGVAALLLSYARKTNKFKLSTADDYRRIFKQYTTPVNNGNYKDKKFYQGFGIIDPRKFIEAMSH